MWLWLGEQVERDGQEGMEQWGWGNVPGGKAVVVKVMVLRR